jgi:hypothetical protein
MALHVSLVIHAQTQHLQLGYQELPTQITGQAADPQGNQYYAGTFKGELKINNAVVATGKGLEDMFLVKTDANGKLTYCKTFGSANTEIVTINTLSYSNNLSLTFAGRILDKVAFGSVPAEPYRTLDGAYAFANCIVHTDTAGNVKWVKRTTLTISRIYATAKVIHVFASLPPTATFFNIEDSTVASSAAGTGLTHLMLDLNGRVLGINSIACTSAFEVMNLLQVGQFSDGKLFMALRFNTTDSIKVNGKNVAVASGQGSYCALVKTDTAFKNFKIKTLNPQRHNLAGPVSNLLPTDLSIADSVYALAIVEGGTPSAYTMDGFTLPYHQNTLLVFDSSLTLRRTNSLSASYITAHSLSKRKLYYRNVRIQDNTLYFSGSYLGINETPVNSIAKRDTMVPVLHQFHLDMDLNGSSKSFIAKVGLNGQGAKAAWYGSHSLFENSSIMPSYFNMAGANRLAFGYTQENTWNPWLVDTSLAIVTGSMKSNADGAEIPHMVQYLSDGSRVIIGYARGKTALDQADQTIKSNAYRRDVFLCRILASGQVKWFKRFASTLQAGDVRKMVVKEDKIYFLVNYTGSVNDSNYLKVDNNQYSFSLSSSLLAVADSSGKMNMLSLDNPVYRNTQIRDFDFFSNGDLLLMANGYGGVNYPAFPAGVGWFLLRANAQTGSFLSGRKLVAHITPSLNAIATDRNDKIYITYFIPNSPANPTLLYNMHDGNRYIDSIRVPHQVTSGNSQVGVLKMHWNGFDWFKRTSGDVALFNRNTSDVALLNQEPVLFLHSSERGSLYWDNALIHSSASTNRAFTVIVRLDTLGVLKSKKLLPASFFFSRMKKLGDERLFVSGMSSTYFQVDTIFIGNEGSFDALGLVLDASLTAKRHYRLHTPYSESMFDFDIYKDSIATFAFTAQTNPSISSSRVQVAATDYDEDAFIASVITKVQTPTGINEPLPGGTTLSVTPNPVRDGKLIVTAKVSETLSTTLYLYNANGQFAGSKILHFAGGLTRYHWQLPEGLTPGIYQVVFVNRKWRTTRTLLVL